MDLSEPTLPVIDITKAKGDEKQYAARVVRALESEGFLYVDGVDADFTQLYQACKWFFSQPLHTKMSVARRPYNPDSPNYYRGYFPVVKGEASRKEAFECCAPFDKKDDPRISSGNWMYEDTPWPREDGSFPFRNFMLQYFQTMTATALYILRLVAIGLEIPPDSFEPMFAKLPLTTLRLIHYPTWEGSGDSPPENARAEDGRLITTPDHADTTFITLLHTFNYDGLERLDHNGVWQPVPCRPGGLVLNIGDTFSRMMGGRFKSTRHRVMDINGPRYSVPYFLEPCFYSDVSVNKVAEWSSVKKGESVEETDLYGPWMIHVMKYVKKFAEARFLPEFEYNVDASKVGFTHESHPPPPPSGSWENNT